MSDHLHLLVRYHQKGTIADLMRIVKSKSSKWLKETFPDKNDFKWQDGYGAFSISKSNIESVNKYIINQIEHHRIKSFQEEFLHFLNVNDIMHDEKYIWK